MLTKSPSEVNDYEFDSDQSWKDKSGNHQHRPDFHHCSRPASRHGILSRRPGLPLLFTAGNMAFFDCGGVQFMLGPASAPELDHPSSILYFSLPDIEAAHRRLVEMGVQIEAPPRLIAPMKTYDLWMVGFRDSEGNVMQLMSEVTRA